jgi:hypothetical protein
VSALPPLLDPEGHRWVRPGSTPCPNCPCCSAALCEKARTDPWEGLRECAFHAARADWDTVKDCPCAPLKKPEVTP